MSSVNQRMQKHRQQVRKAGLQPVQLWVPDTRTAECERQCRIANGIDATNPDLDRIVDEVVADMRD